MRFNRFSLTLIIVAIILIVPIVYYIHQDFKYKNTILKQKEVEKGLRQEAYDKCIRIAEYEYQRETRDMCWVYNHDATDCDLTYFETYKIGELPISTFKKSMTACDEKYPSSERLHSNTSPDYVSLLEKPLGNLSEREAVRKILELQEFKDFAKSPGGTLRYSVDAPSSGKLYWSIHIYSDEESGYENTLNYYKVDALNGEISASKNN
jgi:hypothetical protein